MTEQDDTSTFIPDGMLDPALSASSFLGDKYSRITKLHEPKKGMFMICTAIRYGKKHILKSIMPDHASDPKSHIVLAREFELGIALDHPNIRRTLGFETIDPLGECIVLEYIDGEPLDKAMANGSLSPVQARNILRQTADAIGYLHRRQILHRDIKPANILVTYANRQAKLIDFSHSDSDESVILKGGAGTSQHMAPELTEGKAHATVKSDIYSFGTVARALALHTGDMKLLSFAEKCADPDPDKRPDSLDGFPAGDPESDIFNHTRKFFESKTTTLILAIILAAIWCIITLRLT